ncbi:hypothetical protein BH09MYX1_BH09MYX1_51670 [soil metagenome]
MPSLAEARAYEMDDTDRALLEGQTGRTILGTSDRVRRDLAEIARACEVDEIMALTHVHDHETRKRSYALLAEALTPMR